jgi:hypothetical protein
MSTLTDRYVWGVLRAVPTAQRPELEPEIRALVADAVDARTAAGGDPAAGEHAALAELGDPELLAARYTGRQLVLIGPRFYPDWRRVLGLVLPIVVPIVIIVTIGAAWLNGSSMTELVSVGVGTGVNVAVQVTFWITLVFAVIERSGRASLGDAWTPDNLPELPAVEARPHIAEIVISIVALGVAIAALIWQQLAMPITIDGTGYPLFNPDLWSFWIPWFVVVLGLEIVFTFVRWARGGWTWVLAAVNLALNVAFTIPAVWLLQRQMLLDPALVKAIEAQVGSSAWITPTTTVIGVVAVAIASWDSVDGFRKAARRARGAGAGTGR